MAAHNLYLFTCKVHFRSHKYRFFFRFLCIRQKLIEFSFLWCVYQLDLQSFYVRLLLVLQKKAMIDPYHTDHLEILYYNANFKIMKHFKVLRNIIIRRRHETKEHK